MKTSGYTEPPILAILRQAAGGMPVAELRRSHGMRPLSAISAHGTAERACVVEGFWLIVTRHGVEYEQGIEPPRLCRKPNSPYHATISRVFRFA